ncbi:MAG: hypothetical protein ACRCT1_17090 [Microcoleaceae cyanobacterium]
MAIVGNLFFQLFGFSSRDGNSTILTARKLQIAHEKSDFLAKTRSIWQK